MAVAELRDEPEELEVHRDVLGDVAMLPGAPDLLA